MLITTCTQCGARFRVTPGQLNAKQGQVRCGRCRTVFNGFQSLERHPDDFREMEDQGLLTMNFIGDEYMITPTLLGKIWLEEYNAKEQHHGV